VVLALGFGAPFVEDPAEDDVEALQVCLAKMNALSAAVCTGSFTAAMAGTASTQVRASTANTTLTRDLIFKRKLPLEWTEAAKAFIRIRRVSRTCASSHHEKR
jgi:hypothetical protein